MTHLPANPSRAKRPEEISLIPYVGRSSAFHVPSPNGVQGVESGKTFTARRRPAADDLARDFASPPQSAHCWTIGIGMPRRRRKASPVILKRCTNRDQGVSCSPFGSNETAVDSAVFNTFLRSERLNSRLF